MHNSKLKQISVALCMALVPISVFAAGLGKLNVMSGLGEPLKADIELISATPEELSSITAAIASDEAYAVQGIEKPASHNSIKVAVAKNAAGTPILKLNSAQPISEPFLDMLIQVDWASGRLLREYTVLLDPPGYTGETDQNSQATSTAQAPMVKSSGATTHPIAQSEPMADGTVNSAPASSKKVSKRAKKVVPVDETAATDATGQEYVTQRGDTLAEVARGMKPEGVSLEQMLVGLYEANPDAFQGKNMNRLKVGQIIRQPSADALSAISRNDAAKEIKVQTANWNEYRNKLAGIVANAAPSDAETSAQSAGGKIKGAEDKSAPTASGPKDVVKLSAGDAAASKASADNVKSLQDKITALQEEATAREKSVKEAQDRTASLEKQIADMQKLLAMKNGAMAEMQKKAELQANTEKPAEVKPAEAKPVEAAPAVPAPEAQKPAETPVAAPSAPAKPAEATKPTPVAKPAPTPVEEPSFLGSMMDNLDLGILAPAGGLLALLGGGWMYLRKKREKSLADFEQGIMTSGGLKANTVFGNTASASVDTGDTSFLTDFSQSGSSGMIDTNDVDPIAEAEVYMAYGRDAQAEEILKDAISKEPKRYELHLKLLEMYAASKNFSAFETIAGELYTTLGAEDPTWAKVAEIGIKLEPSNPLYQAGNSPTGSAEKLDATDFSDSPLAAEKDLDFSFDNKTLVEDFAAPAAEKAAEVADTFDMDVGAPEVEPTQAPVTEAVMLNTTVQAEAAPEKVDDAMDFDMGDLGTFESTKTYKAPSKEVTEDFGHTMPSLDVPTFATPQFMPETPVTSETTTDASFETFEFPQVDAPKADAVHDLSDEVEFASDSDFNFDVATISPEAASFKDTGMVEASAVDLTSIDLEMNDGAANKAHDAFNIDEVPATSAAASTEPIEVETKLELVTAYIEMDDKVGAKELLEEVLKEGGANQRKRAEEILAKLA